MMITCVNDKEIHILRVAGGHWTVMEMKARILALCAEWNVGLVRIEDTSSGMGVLSVLAGMSALGHSLQTHSTPVSINVCSWSVSDQIAAEAGCRLSAISGQRPV
jgi:hypothetical protein